MSKEDGKSLEQNVALENERQNMPSVLRNNRGEAVWKLPGNTPEQNEQLGIRNMHALLLEKIPRLGYCFSNEGRIREDSLEEARELIEQKCWKMRDFKKLFGGSALEKKRAPYFLGSHAIALKKSVEPWGISLENITERFKRTEYMEDESFSPSADFAWILGILSAGGNVSPIDNRISLSGTFNDLLESFMRKGEKVFKLKPAYKLDRILKDGTESHMVRFYSRSIVLGLGDFRRTEWVRTINGKYKWILENPQYILSFLEGFFEIKGSIDIKPQIRLLFNVQHLNGADFILNALRLVGIENCGTVKRKRKGEEISGVRIYKSDLKLFADNVHSAIPEKERRLEICRGVSSEEKKELNKKDSKQTISSEEANEWFRKLLGEE